MKAKLWKICASLCLCLALFGCGEKSNDEDPAPMEWEQVPPNHTDNSEHNRFDFEFTIGFDNKLSHYYEDGTSYYMIFMGWGVPSGLFARDITEFGIEVYTSDGTIENKIGWDGDVYHAVNGQWHYFSGGIYNNSAYNWVTHISITSKKQHIVLKYRWKLWDHQTNQYITSSWSESEDFSVRN